LKDKEDEKKKPKKAQYTGKARKAGRNSGPGWKKPRPRHKDPWNLLDGWCNQNLISAMTVNLRVRPMWGME